jgi:hypothetical protein
MKTFLALLVLLAAPAALMAETVMVSVGGVGLGEDPGAGYRFCFSAIESGIMDSFFDAGHIIFNDGDFRSSEDFFKTVRVARDGGAHKILFVDCVYADGGAKNKKTQDGMEVSLPQKIVLSYVRASDSVVLKKVEVRISEKDAEKYPFAEDYYALLGRKAAESLL